MASFNLLLFVYIIYTINMASDALVPESIVSEHLADPHEFTYQVAIIGKKNGTNVKNLTCSGGIITKNLILTAAQCFVNAMGQHKKFTYSVLVDTIDIYNKGALEIDIDLIFLVSSDSYYVDDIALAKLIKDLDIVNNPHISELVIPNETEDFQGREGKVAGYGNNWIPFYSSVRAHERLVGSTDGLLRYLRIRILNDSYTILGHPHFNFITQFFGLALGSNEAQGLCDNDAGCPLVFDNKIVGVASSWRYNCDDTIFGGLYTSVAEYADFIKAIIKEKPENSTIIYRNRPHILVV